MAWSKKGVKILSAFVIVFRGRYVFFYAKFKGFIKKLILYINRILGLSFRWLIFPFQKIDFILYWKWNDPSVIIYYKSRKLHFQFHAPIGSLSSDLAITFRRLTLKIHSTQSTQLISVCKQFSIVNVKIRGCYFSFEPISYIKYHFFYKLSFKSYTRCFESDSIKSRHGMHNSTWHVTLKTHRVS